LIDADAGGAPRHPRAPTVDTRSIKALEIAAGAGQWAKIRSKDGQRKVYGIPSSCQPGRFYLVDQHSCDCADAK
jgi:hypothetical protein